MKTFSYIRTICLFIILMNVSAYAQGQTISFQQGSDVLVDTYKDNSTALSQIGNVIRENKADIINGSGYVEISSLVETGLLTNNFMLNMAATRASVVRAYLSSKYGLNKSNHIIFRYESSCESNAVAVRYIKGAIPTSAQRNIYYTRQTADVSAINSTIAKYGDKIPTNSNANASLNLAPAPIQKSRPIEIKQPSEPVVSFRHSSETIYRAYKDNGVGLELIADNVKQNLADIQSGQMAINLTSFIPVEQKANPAAINLASLRAAMVRQWLINNISGLTEENFRFAVSFNNNEAVRVECLQTNDNVQKSKIYFTKEKQNQTKIAEILSWYKISPMVSGVMELGQYDMDFVNSDLDPTEITIITGDKDDKIHITIYFRWNKDLIDPTYLTNAHTLHVIDSLMSLRSAEYIDTLRITAFASPEGPPVYNQNLSERRAESFRQYILKNYPKFGLTSVFAEGKGENWEGFRRLAEADQNLPRKAEILSIIDNLNLSLAQRQASIVNLDGGRIYKDYIYPQYYPKLRSGASLFVVYNPGMPVDINFEPLAVMVVEPQPEPEPEPLIDPEPIVEEIIELPAYRYIRPFTLKTNLLFDAATLSNIELEVPIGKIFSILGEWTFPFWGGLGNRGGVAPIPVYSEKYTLQMLSGGLEVRYWFSRGKRLDSKATKWDDYNPLCGWFVGPYVGRGLYDFQFGGNGIQGDFYIAAGISGGFAHPIGKYFHLEYSVGVGYLQTEYERYTPMDGHKVYQNTGRYTWLGPTKAKVSFVWIPRFKINNNKRGMK